MEVKPGEVEDLIQKADEIRNLTIDELAGVGIGHVGGCLSIVEVLTVLYYRFMKVNPSEPKMPLRDRLVLSKGHAGPTLYATLAHKGFFEKSLLEQLNKPGTILPSHCDMLKTTGIDMTTGSLGQGFSSGVGMAVGSKIKQDGVTIYTIIGDGESQEGQIWEAAMYAGAHELDNIIAFTDYNRMQIDGTVDEVVKLDPLDKKWEAFGWHVVIVEDGHDMEEISQAIVAAKAVAGRPSMIILNTIKGKGLEFAEKAGVGNHNMVITREMVEQEKQRTAAEGV